MTSPSLIWNAEAEPMYIWLDIVGVCIILVHCLEYSGMFADLSVQPMLWLLAGDVWSSSQTSPGDIVSSDTSRILKGARLAPRGFA